MRRLWIPNFTTFLYGWTHRRDSIRTRTEWTRLHRYIVLPSSPSTGQGSTDTLPITCRRPLEIAGSGSAINDMPSLASMGWQWYMISISLSWRRSVRDLVSEQTDGMSTKSPVSSLSCYSSCRLLFICCLPTYDTIKIKRKQDCQALLKAKYCPRVAAVASAGSNKVAPPSEWHFVNPGQLVQAVSCTRIKHQKHVTLTIELDIQRASRGCQGTCWCKISSS